MTPAERSLFDVDPFNHAWLHAHHGGADIEEYDSPAWRSGRETAHDTPVIYRTLGLGLVIEAMIKRGAVRSPCPVCDDLLRVVGGMQK